MLKKFYISIICFCTVFLILLLSVITTSLDRSFFEKQYVKNETAIQTQMTIESLNIATDKLLDYLAGSADDLDVELQVNGTPRQVFDEREKEHMEDVQNLFVGVIKIAIGFSVFVLAGVVLFAVKGNLVQNFYKPYRNAFLTTTIFSVVVGAVFTINFNWFWVKFHEVLFTNDLWLLDPATSIMINMFPLDFFYNICFVILVKFLVVNFILCTVLLLANKIKKKTR